jgi:hypothetical protein
MTTTEKIREISKRRIQVGDHQYYIQNADSVVGENLGEYDTKTGLVCASRTDLVIVRSGTNWGWIYFNLQRSETAAALGLDSWDEVVEFSMEFEDENACITSPLLDKTSYVPGLSAAGPGWYRVRVHARGRDAAARDHRDDDSDPLEEHLIQVWPAPPGPEIAHKLTDEYGRAVLAGLA